jgi:hypothetical protein
VIGGAAFRGFAKGQHGVFSSREAGCEMQGFGVRRRLLVSDRLIKKLESE